MICGTLARKRLNGGERLEEIERIRKGLSQEELVERKLIAVF